MVMSVPIKLMEKNEIVVSGAAIDSNKNESAPKIDMTKAVDANSETSEEGGFIWIEGKRFREI